MLLRKWFQSSSEETFFQLPIPIYEQIISYFQEDKKTLKSLRLVCRLFRNLTTPFWKQVIPKQLISKYFSNLKQCHFKVQCIVILDKDAKILEFNLKDKASLNEFNIINQ